MTSLVSEYSFNHDRVSRFASVSTFIHSKPHSLKHYAFWLWDSTIARRIYRELESYDKYQSYLFTLFLFTCSTYMKSCFLARISFDSYGSQKNSKSGAFCIKINANSHKCMTISDKKSKKHKIMLKFPKYYTHTIKSSKYRLKLIQTRIQHTIQTNLAIYLPYSTLKFLIKPVIHLHFQHDTNYTCSQSHFTCTAIDSWDIDS